jgi:hypothetical protein
MQAETKVNDMRASRTRNILEAEAVGYFYGKKIWQEKVDSLNLT